ncbi:MAG: 5-formyltetrahydrofolate cyclo-ligase [Tannerella sp.]|jgi:5-formyltetrahydrofolate cyclo-ligase|nr:5-formyltetrahydrofolate cyclo-ligase [Tannerella sp.]
MTDNKQFIRKRIAEYKKHLSKETIADLSRKICNRLVQTDVFQKAKCIALYCAMEDEVQTSGLIEEWYMTKKIVLPVVSGENIFFFAYTGKNNLVKSAFGINEPVATELISPENIDLFIIPGIAFDYKCNRMGRGKGYYDRYLAGINKPAIGICFDFQLLEHIPAESHDKKMTLVITEKTTVSSHHQ